MPHARIRPRLSTRRAFDHGRPIALLPTAPIIGMLLIVAMLILATAGRVDHVVLVNLPPPSPWSASAGPTDRITVSRDGLIGWNGVRVTPAELSARMRATRYDTRAHALIFEADGQAGYGTVAETLNRIRLAGMTAHSFCFAGLERHRRYEEPAEADGRGPVTCRPEPPPPIL